MDNINVSDNSDKNQIFDIQCQDKSFLMIIEIKERFFTDNSHFLKQEDILLELVQHWYSFGYQMDNQSVNNTTCASKINTSIGWFYKCNADRLFYFRHVGGAPYDLIDIDFRPFKNWMLDNMHKFQLQFSNKTTQTVNILVPILDIPCTMYNHTCI